MERLEICLNARAAARVGPRDGECYRRHLLLGTAGGLFLYFVRAFLGFRSALIRTLLYTVFGFVPGFLCRVGGFFGAFLHTVLGRGCAVLSSLLGVLADILRILPNLKCISGSDGVCP